MTRNSLLVILHNHPHKQKLFKWVETHILHATRHHGQLHRRRSSDIDQCIMYMKIFENTVLWGFLESILNNSLSVYFTVHHAKMAKWNLM